MIGGERHLSSISLKTCLSGSTSSGNRKNHKKDTAEIHLMFTANEEIKEGKFSKIEHFDSRRFFELIFFHILRVSQSD